MSTKMKRVLFVERPKGKSTEHCFQIEETDAPKREGKGILCKTLYLSVDPYMSSRMKEKETYVTPWELGKVPVGGGVGHVLESNVDNYKKGDLVYTFEFPFQEMVYFSENQLKNLTKLDKALSRPSYALSILGMPGLTAYFGTTDILQPKEGETLVVTAAAGAVGSMAGQIAKIMGARVIGIAGDDQKLKKLQEWGFDETLNYKKEGDKLKESLKKLCPDKINCFFDNVGGPIMDAVTQNMAIHGRICICGAISQYHGEHQTGPRMNQILLEQSLSMKGFIVMRDYGNRSEEGLRQMNKWMNDGKIKVEETTINGIENLPKAFSDLFEGKNIGKMIVAVSKLESAE